MAFIGPVLTRLTRGTGKVHGLNVGMFALTTHSGTHLVLLLEAPKAALALAPSFGHLDFPRISCACRDTGIRGVPLHPEEALRQLLYAVRNLLAKLVRPDLGGSCSAAEQRCMLVVAWAPQVGKGRKEISMFATSSVGFSAGFPSMHKPTWH